MEIGQHGGHLLAHLGSAFFALFLLRLDERQTAPGDERALLQPTAGEKTKTIASFIRNGFLYSLGMFFPKEFKGFNIQKVSKFILA